jgi:antitoxin MazE
MKVAKWGGSLAVRLPKELVDAMGLKEGDDLRVDRASQSVIQLTKRRTREEILIELQKFKFSVPDDYVFDRDDANAR